MEPTEERNYPSGAEPNEMTNGQVKKSQIDAVNNREFNFALQFSPSGYFQILKKVPVELTSFLHLI